jgi:hypothetical protein
LEKDRFQAVISLARRRINLEVHIYLQQKFEPPIPKSKPGVAVGVRRTNLVAQSLTCSAVKDVNQQFERNRMQSLVVPPIADHPPEAEQKGID